MESPRAESTPALRDARSSPVSRSSSRLPSPAVSKTSTAGGGATPRDPPGTVATVGKEGLPQTVRPTASSYLAFVKPDPVPQQVLAFLNAIWNWLAEPLLFSTIGSMLVLDKTSSFGKCVFLVVFCVLCVRVPMAYLACGGGGLNRKEKTFIALSWMPKATVQAALASVPLDKLLSRKKQLTLELAKAQREARVGWELGPHRFYPGSAKF